MLGATGETGGVVSAVFAPLLVAAVSPVDEAGIPKRPFACALAWVSAVAFACVAAGAIPDVFRVCPGASIEPVAANAPPVASATPRRLAALVRMILVVFFTVWTFRYSEQWGSPFSVLKNRIRRRRNEGEKFLMIGNSFMRRQALGEGPRAAKPSRLDRWRRSFRSCAEKAWTLRGVDLGFVVHETIGQIALYLSGGWGFFGTAGSHWSQGRYRRRRLRCPGNLRTVAHTRVEPEF